MVWILCTAKTLVDRQMMQFSLCARYGAKDLSILRADSEDLFDWVAAQADRVNPNDSLKSRSGHVTKVKIFS